MAFKTKTEYYGLSPISGIELVSVNENRTIQTAEAKGEDGFVIAQVQYGEKTAPSEEFVVKGNVNLSSIVLGSVTNVDNKNYALASVTINTSAGSATKISVSGQQIENGNVTGCTATVPSINVSGLHHAQTFGAFTISGNGAHLTQCNLAINATITTATKEGNVIAHDISDGRMTITGTIVVSDASYGIPELTLTDGWIMSAPLNETNPDTDFPSYAFTLVKYLTADNI